MTYSENLRKVAEAQKQKLEAQAKHQEKMATLQSGEKKREDKFVIDQQKLDDKKTLDQQNLQLNQQKQLIEAAKTGADVRLKDSQSLKTQGEALAEAQTALGGMVGEEETTGKEGEKKKPGLFSNIKNFITGKSRMPDEETLQGVQQPTPVAPTDEEAQAYQQARLAEQQPTEEDEVMDEIGLGQSTSIDMPSMREPAYPSETENIVKEYLPAMQRQAQREFDRAKKETEEYRQSYLQVHKEAQKRARYAKEQLNETFKLQEELSKNPPLRAQALSNINLFGKIGAIIHAGIQGMLVARGVEGAGGSLLINDLIDREYDDLLTQ